MASGKSDKGYSGRKRFVPALVAALLLAGIGVAFAYSMTGPADVGPSRSETVLMIALRRVFIPLHARHVPSPPKLSSEALLEGRKIFLQACSKCHAASGRGDDRLAGSFYPPVPDITNNATQNSSDRELFWIIRNGIRLTGMPAWRSSLDDQQTWDVVFYVRRLADTGRESSRRAQNVGESSSNLRALAMQTIEEQGCRDCHLIAGQGATIGPNLSDEWARGRTDEWLLGHFRNPNAYTPGSLMPSFSHLSDRQLKALVLFLQETK